MWDEVKKAFISVQIQTGFSQNHFSTLMLAFDAAANQVTDPKGKFCRSSVGIRTDKKVWSEG